MAHREIIFRGCKLHRLLIDVGKGKRENLKALFQNPALSYEI